MSQKRDRRVSWIELCFSHSVAVAAAILPPHQHLFPIPEPRSEPYGMAVQEPRHLHHLCFGAVDPEGSKDIRHLQAFEAILSLPFF